MDTLAIHREIISLMRRHGFVLAAQWFRVGDLDEVCLAKWRDFDRRRAA